MAIGKFILQICSEEFASLGRVWWWLFMIKDTHGGGQVG
jgi:hypothetical protein